MTTNPPLVCIAYHEAGHAVAAFRLERKFRSITIEPDPDGQYLGCLTMYPNPPTFHPDIEVTARGERWLRDSIMGSLAGELADNLHCGRVNTDAVYFYGHDMHTAVDLALRFVNEGDELEQYLGWLRARTKTLLQRDITWAGLEALAAALLQR